MRRSAPPSAWRIARWPRRCRLFSFIAAAFLGLTFPRGEGYYLNQSAAPPALEREFRGVWVATVANLDWPSQPGLSSARQQHELIEILNRAGRELNLNAVILQVRSVGDALYAGEDPWSYYLTGELGRAPDPYYDPLAFAVHHAHLRGLELHAWINPFRVGYSNGRGPVPASHISKRRPDLVREYGKYLWLDPGEPGVEEYLSDVVVDIVRRYDVDAIHIDDYFYPDPVLDGRRRIREFPDDASYESFRKSGGKENRGEWRRMNVNRIIKSLYQTIKTERPWVKFGISPKGIWKPGYPEGIVGMNAYREIYADSRLWLRQGWLDYFSPQLYWSIHDVGQQFPLLLHWWSEQNILNRHLWPGLATYKAGGVWENEEILNQVRRTRILDAPRGNIHYRMSGLMQKQGESGGIGDSLKKNIYQTPALVPASPWLSSEKPKPPKLKLTWRREQKSLTVQWKSDSVNPVAWHVLQAKFGDVWFQQILPQFVAFKEFSYRDDRPLPDFLAIRDVDRFGNESRPVVLEYHAPAPD